MKSCFWYIRIINNKWIEITFGKHSLPLSRDRGVPKGIIQLSPPQIPIMNTHVHKLNPQHQYISTPKP